MPHPAALGIKAIQSRITKSYHQLLEKL